MALYIDKNKAIPWGRNFDEYRRMFALSDEDLRGRILGCADGPASFNVELTARGGSVVSADPIYSLSPEDIAERIEVARDLVMRDTYKSLGDYCWDVIPSPDALEAARMGAMAAFLEDFRRGDSARYVPAVLPELPFENRQFDLALCSHFLFLYSEQFDCEFHVAGIEELLRVAAEVRVFPLLDMKSRKSAHLGPILERLECWGRTGTIERVAYEFQIGACEMLRIC